MLKKEFKGKKRKNVEIFYLLLSTFCSPFVEFFFIYYDKKKHWEKKGAGERGRADSFVSPYFLSAVAKSELFGKNSCVTFHI